MLVPALALGIAACSSSGGAGGGSAAATSCQVEQVTVNGGQNGGVLPEQETSEKVTITNNGSSPLDITGAAVTLSDSDGQPVGGGEPIQFTDSDGNTMTYLASGHTVSTTFTASPSIASCTVVGV